MFKELINAWKADGLLEQAWQSCYRALDISRQMFVASERMLREDVAARQTRPVRARDKQINQSQREVRRMVLTHSLLQQRGDPVTGMILVSIIIDIERIGDNIKNMLDLAEGHPAQLQVPTYEDQLRDIERHVEWAFGEVEQALREQDAERARVVMTRHKRHIRKVCRRILNELVGGKAESMPNSQATALVLYVRYLKRISAHLKNIASSVVNPFERIGYKP